MLAHAHASPLRRPARYERRRPEQTALHQVVREHMQTVLSQAAERSEHGFGYPAYVAKEFHRYLDCGQLARGFCRLVCRDCGHEQLLAFSCKGRLCPSCTGRRMDETGAKLVDHLLPRAPYRQWVLTVPWRIRLRLASDKRLLSKVLSALLRTVFAFQRRRARRLGITKPLCGAVSFVHRFNSLLRLSPHYHSFLLDGVLYESEPGTLSVAELPPPSDNDIAKLLLRVAIRIEQLVGLHAEAHGDEPDDEQVALARSLAEAARPMGQARLPAGLFVPPPDKARCAHIDGYSLHADVAVDANDRAGLERLLRYGARPALSQRRLSRTPSGKVRYRLRKRSFDGRNHIDMAPEDFVRRLAALIPPPWLNLTRFHGVFAPRSKHRKLLRPLVPRAQSQAPTTTEDTDGDGEPAAVTTPVDLSPEPLPKHIRIAWAELLRRTFALDALACPRCDGGRMRLVATIKDPNVIAKILTHLGLPKEPPPVAPARAPPQLHFDDDLFV
jgi:hypothetical protein